MGREAEIYREGSGLPTPQGSNWGTGPLLQGPLGTPQPDAESHLVRAAHVKPADTCFPGADQLSPQTSPFPVQCHRDWYYPLYRPGTWGSERTWPQSEAGD